MRNVAWLGVVVATGVLAFLAGRTTAGGGVDSAQVADSSPVVVEHGVVRVRAREVAAVLEEDGERTRAAPSVEARRKTAARLLRTRVLAARARDAGMDKDPALAHRLEQVLADAYLRRELSAASPSPSEQELRAYFEANRATFTAAPRLRLAHILIAAPVGAADRKSRREKAVALLAEARKAVGTDYYGFAALARAGSDDGETKPFGGELPWLTEAEAAARFGQPVVAAATQLKPGELLPELVTTDAGFHIVRLVARDPGSNPSYQELVEMLRTRWIAERQQARREELSTAIDSGPEVRWHEDALAGIR